MTLQQLHDRLLAWATAEPRRERLLEARRLHFGAYGEPHEEDRTYEPRVNGMLDYYLYDFRPTAGGRDDARGVPRRRGTGARPRRRVPPSRRWPTTSTRSSRCAEAPRRPRCGCATPSPARTSRSPSGGSWSGWRRATCSRPACCRTTARWSSRARSSTTRARRASPSWPQVKRLKKAAGKGGHPDVAGAPGPALAHGLQAGALPQRPARVDLRLLGRDGR